ncbi:hypothetical protein [Rhodopseudomonas sp. AAP120]|uniref:hypothetical protein n=1 Tax=Rhodopseudomonas sp. AAP120 TaxID=1523430 RepID=UPI0012E27BEF|nr:hypothetical protein [Rhodopseudomonas sp. AAP120]
MENPALINRKAINSCCAALKKVRYFRVCGAFAASAAFHDQEPGKSAINREAECS